MSRYGSGVTFKSACMMDREQVINALDQMIVVGEADFGIHLNAEHYEDHSDYLKSWIGALKNDYTIFFQAAADAEKAADRIVGRYRDRYMVKDQKEIAAHQEDKKQAGMQPEHKKSGKKVR